MSNSQIDIVYTQDDEKRYEEIVTQIHWQKSHTRRKSILEAAEIIRILKTKKHEYDCFGNSLINFLYGVEVVRIMKTLNVSYVEDTEKVFKENLKKELAYAFHKRDEFIATLNKRKANLINIDLDTLRTEALEDAESSEQLIKSRYTSFFRYFQMIVQMYREIAGIVEITDELKIIKSRISSVMAGLREKKEVIIHIAFELILDYLSDDIDHAIEVLNCQADSLAENILANIADINALMNLFGRASEDKTEGSVGSGEGEEVSEEESTSSKGEKDELSSLGTSEYDLDDEDGDLGYLMGAVGKPLILSLANCALRHPADPICFVSGFMRNYRIKEVQAQRKNEELNLLLAERERIQLLKKARQEEELRKRMEEAMLLAMNSEGNE